MKAEKGKKKKKSDNDKFIFKTKPRNVKVPKKSKLDIID